MEDKKLDIHPDHVEEYNSLRQSLEHKLILYGFFIENFLLVMQIDHMIYLEEEILEIFVNNFNTTLLYIFKEDASKELKIKDMDKVKYNPKYIVAKIISLYASLGQYP